MLERSLRAGAEWDMVWGVSRSHCSPHRVGVVCGAGTPPDTLNALYLEPETKYEPASELLPHRWSGIW